MNTGTWNLIPNLFNCVLTLIISMELILNTIRSTDIIYSKTLIISVFQISYILKKLLSDYRISKFRVKQPVKVPTQSS